MVQDPRWRWTTFSGMTRAEQRVLIFLILVIGAGLGYQCYQGGGRSAPLVLHRGEEATGPSGASIEETPSRSAADPSGREPRDPEPPAGPIDLNAASAQDLEALPGIGPVTAALIIRQRETQGPFQRLDDLKKVSGIGEKTYQALVPYLQPIEAAQTAPAPPGHPRVQMVTAPGLASAPAPRSTPLPIVNLNTAGAEELDTLEGIGPALAQRIIDDRRTRGPFRNIEDIQRVRGIGKVVLQKNRHRMTVGRPK